MTDTAVNRAEQLAEILIKTSSKLVTAESCTGGGLAEILTRVPDSSAWFERGFISYSNISKQEMLSVPLATLEQFGAVSEETAVAMAKGAVENSHADYAVAITGIAGPGGGSEAKPIGTVCFAWWSKNKSVSTTNICFVGDRRQIRQQACILAIQRLTDLLKKTSAW